MRRILNVRRTLGGIRRLHAVSGVVENGREKLYITGGVRGGGVRSWQGRQKKPERSARISRKHRASLPRTNRPHAVPWSPFAFALWLQAALFPSRAPGNAEGGVPVVCGIVGYVGDNIDKDGKEGQQRCVEVLMEGLRRLEYRG